MRGDGTARMTLRGEHLRAERLLRRAVAAETALAERERAEIESALAVLAQLSERRTGNGRLRDAIALVRDALWDDLDA